ncbi:MAG TPA: hypothetical protein VF158_16055 [Longimicrobiales bacterium]
MSGETAGGPAEGARLTPYELVFGDAAFERERFPAIRAAVEALGVDTGSPERFLVLDRVRSLLRELAPDEPGADVYGRYGALVYQAWHFWRYGRRVLVLDATAARRLVEGYPDVGVWELTPPYPAGYVQLPLNLFWARVEESAPAEPVDGWFWTMLGREDPESPPYERLDVLLVLGMRPGRPGFGTVPVAAELGGAPVGHWADAAARPGGGDFSNVLPGGELRGLYALVTELEVLKLVSRVFRHLAVHPEALGAATRAGPSPAPGPRRLPPSALPYLRILPVGDG